MDLLNKIIDEGIEDNFSSYGRKSIKAFLIKDRKTQEEAGKEALEIGERLWRKYLRQVGIKKVTWVRDVPTFPKHGHNVLGGGTKDLRFHMNVNAGIKSGHVFVLSISVFPSGPPRLFIQVEKHKGVFDYSYFDISLFDNKLKSFSKIPKILSKIMKEMQPQIDSWGHRL